MEEYTALVPPGADAPGQSAATVSLPGTLIRGEYLAEEIFAVEAEVLGEFVDGRLRGRPAFTMRDAGGDAGHAYYLATIPDDDGMRDVMAHILGRAGIEPVLPGLSERVEAVRRGDHVIITNYESTDVTISVSGTDAMTGDVLDTVVLAPFAWTIAHAPLV
jgi:beta-galactosidase